MVVFDDETLRISKSLQELRAKQLHNGHLQLDGIAAMQMSQLFSEMSNVHFSEELQALVDNLNHPENYDLPQLDIAANIRDYQYYGIKWLSSLDKYGFGGVLADDMGLGKTLQTIAFLSSKLTKDSKILILCPSSLLYNWADEFEKFAPSLDVVVSYGLKTGRDQLISQSIK